MSSSDSRQGWRGGEERGFRRTFCGDERIDLTTATRGASSGDGDAGRAPAAAGLRGGRGVSEDRVSSVRLSLSRYQHAKGNPRHRYSAHDYFIFIFIFYLCLF